MIKTGGVEIKNKAEKVRRRKIEPTFKKRGQTTISLGVGEGNQ